MLFSTQAKSPETFYATILSEKDLKVLDREKEKKQKYKDYESRRTREFKRSWTAKYPWVRYDEESRTMYCMICREENQCNAFSEGTSSFRTTTIESHGKSAQHNRAVVANNAKKSSDNKPT